MRLTLENRLSEPTNLHWHGLPIPPKVDDPFLEIPPGEAWTYEFNVPEGLAGTFWYHPHLHGRVSSQLFAGLLGAIVVESPLDAIPELREAEEHLLVLKDLALQGGGPAPHTPMDWRNGKEGDLVLVNGALRPTLFARKATLRLRLLNASNLGAPPGPGYPRGRPGTGCSPPRGRGLPGHSRKRGGRRPGRQAVPGGPARVGGGARPKGLRALEAGA